jgi:hypothetical protein
MSRLSVVFVSIALLSGCKKEAEKAPASEPAKSAKPSEPAAAEPAAPAAPAPAPAAPATVDLQKLGLKLDVPGKAELIASRFAPGYELRVEGIDSMSVVLEEGDADTPESLKSRAMESLKDDKPTNFVTEQQADGWIGTFDTTPANMAPLKHVNVYKKLDGKSYRCHGFGEGSQADAILAACKTLRK